MKQDVLYQLCPEISHELKSSLANMQAQVTLLQQKLPRTQQQKIQPHLDKITQDIIEMNTVLSDVVDLIQLSEKRQAFIYSLISLKNLIAETIVSWKKKDISIIYPKTSFNEIVGESTLIKRALDMVITQFTHVVRNTTTMITITEKTTTKRILLTISAGKHKITKGLNRDTKEQIIKDLLLRQIMDLHGGKVTKRKESIVLSFPIPKLQ